MAEKSAEGLEPPVAKKAGTAAKVAAAVVAGAAAAGVGGVAEDVSVHADSPVEPTRTNESVTPEQTAGPLTPTVTPEDLKPYTATPSPTEEPEAKPSPTSVSELVGKGANPQVKEPTATPFSKTSSIKVVAPDTGTGGGVENPGNSTAKKSILVTLIGGLFGIMTIPLRSFRKGSRSKKAPEGTQGPAVRNHRPEAGGK